MKVAILLLCSTLILCACRKERGVEDSEILIGEYTTLTGTDIPFGIVTHEGIELAVSHVNAAGGVLGKKIRLVTIDDENSIEKAVEAVGKLIDEKNVLAIIGEVRSERTLHAAPLAQRSMIPMITPASTNPAVTDIGDYIFRSCFSDLLQGSAMAKFARNYLKARKVAIMKDADAAYSVGLAEYFAESFTKLGGTIVSDIGYSTTTPNYSEVLKKIKPTKPDVIFIPGYFLHVGKIAVEARKMGIRAKLIGGDTWDSNVPIETGGDAIRGSYFSNHFSRQNKDPRVVDFVKQYEAKFKGHMASGLAAQGYDTVMLLVDAIRRAKELTPAAVRDALAETKNFPGVTGSITINERRDAVKPLVIMKVDGPPNTYLMTIDP